VTSGVVVFGARVAFGAMPTAIAHATRQVTISIAKEQEVPCGMIAGE